MAKRRIFVTEQELEALQQLLSSARSIVQRDYLDDLDQALNDAHVVSPEDKPANFVTINFGDPSTTGPERKFEAILPCFPTGFTHR